MTVRLILEQPCPTCGGSKRIPLWNPINTTNPDSMFYRDEECDACGGTGVRVSPVSCAGCRWWNQGFYCSKTDTFNCEPDHGCLSWTAKEGTDGNG